MLRLAIIAYMLYLNKNSNVTFYSCSRNYPINGDLNKGISVFAEEDDSAEAQNDSFRSDCTKGGCS